MLNVDKSENPQTTSLMFLEFSWVIGFNNSSRFFMVFDLVKISLRIRIKFTHSDFIRNHSDFISIRLTFLWFLFSVNFLKIKIKFTFFLLEIRVKIQKLDPRFCGF